jgi:hypothetical protein
MLPTDPKDRKQRPIATGVLLYFPDAIAEVAFVSYNGNIQHNGPDTPLRWAREKSTDQTDAAVRHLIDHATSSKDTDGCYHLAKAIWRLAAELQLTIEKERA